MSFNRARRFRETIIAPQTLNLAGFYDISDRIRDVPRPKNIIFDFSRSRQLYADCLFPLGAILNDLRSRGALKEIVFPTDRSRMDFLRRCGWFDYLTGEHFNEGKFNKNIIPILTFQNHEDLNNKINYVVKQCIRSLEFKGKSFSLFEWSLNEITGNILDHAKTSKGHIQVVTHPTKSRIAITIYDSGIGTPTCMRDLPEFKDEKSDLCLIETALRKGMTSKPKTNQGLGLAGALAITECSGGMFTIASESAFYRKSHDSVSSDEGAYWHLPGTLVDLQIGTSHEISVMPIGLPEPAYSIIDDLQRDPHTVSFVIKDHFTTLGNRITGRTVYNIAKNLINANPNVVLEIDFEDIGTISSSSADEFVGNLASALQDQFESKIVLKNITEDSLSIISEITRLRLGRSIAIKITKSN